MKYIPFVLILIVGSTTISISQESMSGYSCSTELLQPCSCDITEYVTLSTRDQVQIGIAAHIVGGNSGNGAMSESTLNSIVNLLNSAYSRAKMVFFVKSIDHINNDTYYSIDNETEQANLRRLNVVDNCVNI